MVGHFTDDAVVLDFLASRNHPRLAALGTSCPDHFLRTKVKPMVLDLPATRRWPRSRPGSRSCTRRTAPTTRPTTTAMPPPESPAIRGADPAIVLVPGVGMFTYGARTSRPRAWPASSTSTRST